MKPLSEDTSPEVEAILIERWRRMSAAEKLQILDEMIQFAQAFQEADERTRYPDASDYEIKMRVAERRLGPELMWKAFGWRSEPTSGSTNASTGLPR